MATFNIKFHGRQTGAIGITYDISESYECSNLSELKSMLYRDYEHIRGLKIKEGSKEINMRDYENADFTEVGKRDHILNPRK